MENKPIIVKPAEDLNLKDFTKFYAQAIMEAYDIYMSAKKRILSQLAKDTDKAIQEVTVHRNGEIHFYYMEGTHLEYSSAELGLTDLFK